MQAIQVTEFGGPEVLVLREVGDPAPPDGAALIDVQGAGINYADTHTVENSYLAPAALPLIPGVEVVGTTADGRRVLALMEGGGYAERAVAWPALTWEVPEGVSDATALALGLQGTTAWHLLRTSAKLTPGETVVVHAAAGGVGTLAVQLAKHWGAGRVIASASTEEKRALALELGADVAIDPGSDDLKAAIVEANGGERVDVVLEMAGGKSFEAGLGALAPFGRLVIYGMASREPARDVNPGMLLNRSRAVIGFWLAHCFLKPEMLTTALDELFALVASGELHAIEGGSYALADARQAHEDIRARKTSGKLVLIP